MAMFPTRAGAWLATDRLARWATNRKQFPRGDAPGYGDYGRWPIGRLSSGIANITVGHW